MLCFRLKNRSVCLADGTKLEVSDAMGCGFLYFGSLIYSKRGTIYAHESVGFTGGRIVCTSAGSEVLYLSLIHISA